MIIVLKISREVIRIIAVYLLHADYAFICFQIIFSHNERLVMEARDKRHAVVIAWDIKLSFDQGVRDRILQYLCSEFSLDIANESAFE